MNTLLLGAALSFVGVVLGLVLVLLAEVIAGCKRTTALAEQVTEAPSYVVLMPAHDEASGISTTVETVLQQLPTNAFLLVVADNCSDDTAKLARAAGAQVIERSDSQFKGKGYALAFGVAHLRAAPPAVLIILDADCVPTLRSLDILAHRAASSQRPMQALDLMLAQEDGSLRSRMAAFAWAVKNHMRPAGLHNLGFPCQLMGTGMALPWGCVDGVDFASGHLAEDLQLGLKLSIAGFPPKFCPEARVESWFPTDAAGMRSQKTRWEHGHLSMIFSSVPTLLWHGLKTRKVGLLALGLDVCVPPLALLAVIVGVSCGLGAWVAPAGGLGYAIAVAAGLGALAFGSAVLIAWWKVGRRWVSFGELVSAPAYVLRKLPVYGSFLFRRQKEWVRTSRHP
jgi:cellulose synthase/poly-beta-1,6-N-acetylglucosamine synthase-like glycosyltransferase